jgi:hypothetical protein
MTIATTNGTRSVPVMTAAAQAAFIANNAQIQALLAEQALAIETTPTEFNGVTYREPEIRAWMRSAIKAGNNQGRIVMKQVLANKDFSLLEDWVNINGADSAKQCLLSLEDGEKWAHFYNFFKSIGHDLSRGYNGLWIDAKGEEVVE